MTAPQQIPLARPELTEREEELVLAALRSGRLSLGPMLDLFERELAGWLDVEDVVAVSSGTAALHLGVRALGWGEGNEVVTSPFSFVSSANALLYERVTPVFCDVDEVTLNIDPQATREALSERAAGILPIDILGYPCALAELEALATERGVVLLEDGCEALGARDGAGRRLGAAGHATTFAFYANKQLTTGEGGAIVAPDAASAARLRSERNQGRGTDMSWVAHERLGFNYRMTEMQAALGVAQLERLDGLLESRARVAEMYRERLTALDYGAPAGEGDPDGLLLPCDDRGAERRSWFVYAVRLPRGADRDAVLGDLAQRGIEAKAYMPSIHLMPHYRDEFGLREGQFPIAEDASARLLALPFFPGLTESQVDRVCEALAEALRGRWI